MRLRTAQVQHQVFDPDHPSTQKPVLLPLLRFHRSPLIPVYARNRKENRCSHRHSIVTPMNSETDQLLEENYELEIFQAVRV